MSKREITVANVTFSGTRNENHNTVPMSNKECIGFLTLKITGAAPERLRKRRVFHGVRVD